MREDLELISITYRCPRGGVATIGIMNEMFELIGNSWEKYNKENLALDQGESVRLVMPRCPLCGNSHNETISSSEYKGVKE